jgi:hypothetical protein
VSCAAAKRCFQASRFVRSTVVDSYQRLGLRRSSRARFAEGRGSGIFLGIGNLDAVPPHFTLMPRSALRRRVTVPDALEVATDTPRLRGSRLTLATTTRERTLRRQYGRFWRKHMEGRVPGGQRARLDAALPTHCKPTGTRRAAGAGDDDMGRGRILIKDVAGGGARCARGGQWHPRRYADRG